MVSPSYTHRNETRREMALRLVLPMASPCTFSIRPTLYVAGVAIVSGRLALIATVTARIPCRRASTPTNELE